jgi:hypothetical protein
MSKSKNENSAKEKAKDVISKCENCIQINHARDYIDLFHSKFKNDKTYKELYLLFVKKQNELNCP